MFDAISTVHATDQLRLSGLVRDMSSEVDSGRTKALGTIDVGGASILLSSGVNVLLLGFWFG